MTTPILDANGEPIGSFRDNQDPNFPQRFVEDSDTGHRLVDTSPTGIAVEAPVLETPPAE